MSCTSTDCPLVTVPATSVKGPPSIEYVPPVIEIDIGTASQIPETVMLFEVTVVSSSTSTCPAKEKS